MGLAGIDNVDNTKHFVVPTNTLRYLMVKRNTGRSKDNYFVKVFGMQQKIEITKEMFEELRKAMESRFVKYTDEE